MVWPTYERRELLLRASFMPAELSIEEAGARGVFEEETWDCPLRGGER